MVESVDTQDLKSCDHYGCAGSSPAPSTEWEVLNKDLPLSFFKLRKSLVYLEISLITLLNGRVRNFPFSKINFSVKYEPSSLTLVSIIDLL